MPPKITMVCAQERDLDLLLMEELASSPEFASWFLNKIGLSGALLLELAHSVNASNGESDLEMVVECSGARTKVLVEDKVDAQFQPRQAERYRERAASYVSAGACTTAVTVLVAPRAYASGDAKCGFDYHVPLEDLAARFRESNDLGCRREYKLTLLTRTLERSASGWVLVPDDQCTKLWRDYWHLADRLAPELQMPYPKEKPAGSSFVGFRPDGMPKGVEIVHKLAYGNVDIQFAGMGENTAELKLKYNSALAPGMIIERAAKSAVVRMKVPPIDLSLPLVQSKGSAEQGIYAALRLLRWFRQHWA